jgi:adenine/guanine phosphoribosyltransferase-like PRPP-binding protein
MKHKLVAINYDIQSQILFNKKIKYKDNPTIDYQPLLMNPSFVNKIAQNIAHHFKNNGVNTIAALANPRGIIFGSIVAHILKLPLIGIGLSGKMPGNMLSTDTESTNHEAQYLQVATNLLAKGQKFGIINDISSSGKYLYDTCRLLHRENYRSINAVSSVFLNEKTYKSREYYHDLEKVNFQSLFNVSDSGIFSNIDFTIKDITPEYSNRTYTEQEIKNKIIIFKNRIKNNILWTDPSLMIADPEMRNFCCNQLFEHNNQPDKVLGIGVRGYYYSSIISWMLNKPHILAENSKYISLPHLAVPYNMEYDMTQMGIRHGVINPNEQIDIIDDLRATAGTLDAASQAVYNLGGNVNNLAVIFTLKDIYENPNIGRKLSPNLDKKCFHLFEYTSEELQARNAETESAFTD